MTPPLRDIAHLGHAQLFTPDLDASVAFFTDYLGLVVSGRHGDTVYLRTFDDYEHHSLVLSPPANGPASAGSPCAPPARRHCTAVSGRSRRRAAPAPGPRTNPASGSCT